MTAQEGVIKYRLSFMQTEAPDFSCFAEPCFTELNAWRRKLYLLKLIGQTPARYEGYGYGNISHRLKPGKQGFLVSASQTGHLPVLEPEHYVHVTDFDLQQNWLQANGVMKPSSEALSHASIYAGLAPINCVMHVHWPELWQQATALGLPHTSAHIAYGTPEMAQTVQDLVQAQAAPCGVVAMLGHEDGILIYGRDAKEVGSMLAGLLPHDSGRLHEWQSGLIV